MFVKKSLFTVIVISVLLIINGCAIAPPKLPNPAEIVPPVPISNNTGKYMCPYTQDDVVAPWVDKAINASIGSSIGKTAGAYLGAKALEQVPFIGGFIGKKAGDAIGRKIAIEASGGMEYIKETSDLSFNSVEDTAVWLYATKSDNEHFQDVIKAMGDIYPDFRKIYFRAIQNAHSR